MAVTLAPSNKLLPEPILLPQPIQGVDLDSAYKALIEAYVDWRITNQADGGFVRSEP